MKNDDEPLMNLRPKTDFERFLWERNKTTAQAEYIQALQTELAKARREAEELKIMLQMPKNGAKRHIFDLQCIIAKQKIVLGEQIDLAKKLKIESWHLFEKLMKFQTQPGENQTNTQKS